jgi:hypothetical protein
VLKKYFPIIALLAAIALLWYVKKYQRGSAKVKEPTEQTDTHITVPVAPVPSPDNNNNRDEGFNRHVAHITYSKHARCRMECRHIDESEVKEILEKGTVNYNKIENDGRGKTYPLEGETHDGQHVRIVFSPKDNGDVTVVTCIDLDTEWNCNCK